MTNNLEKLYTKHGQSAWLDNLRRDWIDSEELAGWIEKGCRGITSNPTIFAQALSTKGAYDEQLLELQDESSAEHIYWQLVMRDIEFALGMLYPTYEDSNGQDGYVSVEVSPRLANDTEATVAAALQLNSLLDYPNLYIKVPATKAGIKSIQELVGMGVNINVTLIFSLKRYQEVMEAYISGLELLTKNDPTKISQIHSVASFFVSRVDTEVDKRLEATNAPTDLFGKAAVAQAQAAYQLFLKEFKNERFKALQDYGANLQRPLWASVSTKNPNYSDTLYIDTLIGPDTVSTMPDNTLNAFLDHGVLKRTLDADPTQSQAVLSGLAEQGIDMDEVGQQLEDEGVAAFGRSYEEALGTLLEQKEKLLT